MSSLPQGWHGIPVPMRNSASATVSKASTVPTTIRKKWNSSFSSEIPRSKLPSYKPATVRLQRSSINSTLHTRSTSKSSVSQADSATCSSKSLPTKDLQNEISKLKKELTTVKTENSILKVKVRRVDDENIQKSRQIEKLRVELKTAQKSETIGTKKSKDSDVLLLRQKCLRLEGALKEKDVIIKRLKNEMALNKGETGCCKQTASKKANDCNELKQKVYNESKSVGKLASTASTNLSRASQSLKGEVSKLRDMIHKLEKENQDLQQQLKDKGEEIRQLKLHLRSRTYIKPTETSVLKFSAKTSTNIPKSSSTLPNKLQGKKVKENAIPLKPVSSLSNQKTVVMKKPMPHNSPKVVSKPTEVKKKMSHDLKSNKKPSISRSLQQQIIPKKQLNGVNSKLPVTKPGSTFVVTKPEPPKSEIAPAIIENNVEDQVIQMRENLAAKKIQRGWRHHREQIMHKEEPQHIDKAMTFIVTSLKYHKMRKEKLNFVQRQKHSVPKLKEENESAIVDAIRAATKNLWEFPLVN